MKIKNIVAFCTLFLLIQAPDNMPYANQQNAFTYKPFDVSMQFKGKVKTQEYTVFENLYKSNMQLALGAQNNCQPIPKIIHQIWLGPNQIPKPYLTATEILKKQHPDWEYKLWTEKDLKDFDFPDKDLYEKSTSYTERADILRYSILYKFGGVYADMGYFSVKQLDFLNDNFSLYAAISPQYNKEDKEIVIINGIIGAVKKNQIIKNTLHIIRNHWDEIEEKFSEDFKNGNIKLKKSLIISLALKRSMYPIKQAILNYINDNKKLENNNCIIVLPPTYISITERFRPLDSVYKLLNIYNKKSYYSTPHKETIASKIRLQNKIVNNLSKYNFESKLPFYKKIYYKVKYYFKSLIDKFYWDFALKKHMPNKSK